MTARQKRFIHEYLLDLNATQAAIRAGYSRKTARSIGQENLTKPDIVAAISKAQAERAERLQVTADQVADQLRKYGFSSMADYFAEDGRLLEPHEWSPDAAVAVAAVEVVRERRRTRDREGESVTTVQQTIKVKRSDPLRALELFGKHLGMFKDKVEHSGDVSLLEVCRRLEAEEDAAKFSG